MAYEATQISDFGSGEQWRPAPMQHARGHFWRDEEDNLIRSLWADGVSFAAIAKALNARFKPIKRTRNACVGRAHRLGLRRETPTRQITAPRPARRRAPSAPRLREVKRVEKSAPILPPIGASDIIEAAAGTCRFMCGDPKEAYQLCGHPGEPWCAAHRALVYGKGQPSGTAPKHVPLRRNGRILANSIGAFGQ